MYGEYSEAVWGDLRAVCLLYGCTTCVSAIVLSGEACEEGMQPALQNPRELLEDLNEPVSVLIHNATFGDKQIAIRILTSLKTIWHEVRFIMCFITKLKVL